MSPEPEHSSRLPDRYPPLTPLLAPWMKKVTGDPQLVETLLEQHGSPVNLHHLKPFADNYRSYRSVMEAFELKHLIYYARKANTCRAFAREADRRGFGVDTASFTELEQCLAMDCDPSKLVVTAAVKDERLIRLALNHDVLIVLDNKDECRRVNKLAGQLGKTPRVSVRISGFSCEGEKLYSRFGFDIDVVVDFITRRMGPDMEFFNLRFAGFHFHLDGYSRRQRSEALGQTMHLTDRLAEEGISTRFIDMGGGLLVNYLAEREEWDTFWGELQGAVRGKREPLTFGNDGLGYRMVNGRLTGQPDVYPYYNARPKEQFLHDVLAFCDASGRSIAERLRERDIELRMEPGRSLLDQAGMTLARVAHRKRDARGQWLVGLQMNRSQLSSSSADFLLDPIYLPTGETEAGPEPPHEATAVYFTGAYCLEGDLILKRRIVLPRLPAVGNVMAFPNTAGYMMHFYETRSHLLDFTTNLVADASSFPRFERDASWAERR